MKTDAHGLDVVDRYQRRKYHVQQRDKALADLYAILTSRAFLVRLLIFAAPSLFVIAALTVAGVIR